MMIGRRLILASAVLAFAATAQAQQPSPSVTYTLTAEQQAALKRALVLADFWLSVRAAAASNSAEGHGFELERAELGSLAAELQKQETAKAPIAPAPVPSPPAPRAPAAP